MLSDPTNQAANLAKGLAYCREAKTLGCDLALFPEMWNLGYYAVDPNETLAHADDLKSRAIPADSEFVTAHQVLARDLDMVIATTYLEANSPGSAPRGMMVVIDRTGEIVLRYAKVHTCDFDMGAIYEPGTEFPVGVVDTPAGSVLIGGMLCYDREFPESARMLMLNGAEILLTANCCTLDDKRINQFQSRAFENAVAVVMTNYPTPQTNGRSVAFDAQGDLLMMAGEQEGIYLVDLDIAALRSYRSTCGWGNAYRRPHRYGLLTSTEVREPFCRINSLGVPFDRKTR
jgi:predicted amidohydrolase